MEITIVGASWLQCQHLWSFLKGALKNSTQVLWKTGQSYLICPETAELCLQLHLRLWLHLLVFPFLFIFPKPTGKSREEKSRNAYIYDHEKEESHLLWKYISFDALGISCQRFKSGRLGSIKKKQEEEGKKESRRRKALERKLHWTLPFKLCWFCCTKLKCI